MTTDIEMLKMLPKYYEKSRVIDAILRAEGPKFDELTAAIKDLIEQFYIQTATWALDFWEEEYKLPIAPTGLSFEDRRKRLLARKQGQGNLTVEKAKQIVETFVTSASVEQVFEVILRTNLTWGEVRRFTWGHMEGMTWGNIHASYNGNKFVITITNPIGIPDNIEDIKRALDDAKPAHIPYQIVTS